MADWSQLPKDLLQKICQKLNNSELYLLRFRSVCSSWRRASIQKCHHNHLPSRLPQFPHSNQINSNLRRFSKQNIFLIKPPATLTSHHHHPWLIRIGPDVNGKTQILHPFDVHLKHPLHCAVGYCKLVMDFNQIPLIHLGHMFYIHGPSLHYEKVIAAMCEAGQPLSVLTYDDDSDRTLKIFRCEDTSWTSIPTMPSKSLSDWGDICIFKGRPCVAEKNGRTLMIGENLNVFLLAKPVFGGNVKFLVESECDLLLVDCHGIDTGAADKDVRFDVFRLDEKETKWVKLTTLGDRVLFVEQECSFSASASDLHVANGNCIIYSGNSFFRSFDNIQSELCIFYLDRGQGSRRLSNYPKYIRLFSPLPKWILELHNQDESNVSEVIESDNERTNYDDDNDNDDDDDDGDDDYDDTDDDDDY